MRVAVIADWLNPTVEGALTQLSERGVEIGLIYPERQVTALDDLRVEYDLYLLKSGTELALSLGGALHALGAATLNPYPTVALMRNKIILTRMLRQAGVPTPESYAALHPADLEPLLQAGPLILKPYAGSRGEGIDIVHTTDELARITTDQPMVVQRYHPSDGYDRKIFRIGDRLFGIKRIWPLRTYADKLGEPFTPDAQLSEIAMRCGEVLGIDLYGLDIVVSDGEPYVVDVNKFGSYMGVPDGSRLLADYIETAAHRHSRQAGAIPSEI